MGYHGGPPFRTHYSNALSLLMSLLSVSDDAVQRAEGPIKALRNSRRTLIHLRHCCGVWDMGTGRDKRCKYFIVSLPLAPSVLGETLFCHVTFPQLRKGRKQLSSRTSRLFVHGGCVTPSGIQLSVFSTIPPSIRTHLQIARCHLLL